MAKQIVNGVEYSNEFDPQIYAKIGTSPLETQADNLSDGVNELKQSLDDLFKVKNLGIVTNLNLSSVTKGQCYWCAFNQNTTGAPQANSGGYCFTTINSDTSNYGRQIVISNTGIWTRARSGGSYGSWTQLA